MTTRTTMLLPMSDTAPRVSRLASWLNERTRGRPTPAAFYRFHRSVYVRSGGRFGHGLIGTASLVPTTTGRHSHRLRRTVLACARDGDRAACHHPAAIPDRRRFGVYDERMRLLTIGHGTISAEEFVRLLDGAGAARLIDIRSAPGSRHNPQFGRVEMERWLPTAGISYQWERALGGFRKPSPELPNTALRHPAFRGYADYMLTGEFVAGAEALRKLAAVAVVTVMCSESLWWRCHRRLLSDYLMLVHRFDIRHVMHDTSLRDTASPKACAGSGTRSLRSAAGHRRERNCPDAGLPGSQGQLNASQGAVPAG